VRVDRAVRAVETLDARALAQRAPRIRPARRERQDLQELELLLREDQVAAVLDGDALAEV
jgi:hypothetical protein